MPALRAWGRRPVHWGELIQDGSAVSAMCSDPPRAVNYHIATWSMLPELVTCPRCKLLVGMATAWAILEDPGLLIGGEDSNHG